MVRANSRTGVKNKILIHETELKCKICSQSFVSSEEVRGHINNHLEKENCEICGKAFTNKKLLQKHLITHFKKERQLVCSIKDCNKKFNNERSLKYHLMKHVGHLPYACKVCEKSYTNNCALLKHSETHLSEKRFKCNVCGHRCSTRNHLEQHMRTHTKLRPFKCDICDKTFSQKTNLTRHNRIHSGDRPYKCRICGRCFIESGKLTKHYRVHAGCKNYQCIECGKTFAESRNLTQHLLIHSGQKPHCCPICDRSFRYVSDLREHRLVHSDIKSFLCATCGHTFKSNRNLKKHIKKIHNDDLKLNQDCSSGSSTHFEQFPSVKADAPSASSKNQHTSAPETLQTINKECVANVAHNFSTNTINAQDAAHLDTKKNKVKHIINTHEVWFPVVTAITPSYDMNTANTLPLSTSGHCITNRNLQYSAQQFGLQYITSNRNDDTHFEGHSNDTDTAVILYPEQVRVIDQYSLYPNSCGQMNDKTLLDISSSTFNKQYSETCTHLILTNSGDTASASVHVTAGQVIAPYPSLGTLSDVKMSESISAQNNCLYALANQQGLTVTQDCLSVGSQFYHGVANSSQQVQTNAVISEPLISTATSQLTTLNNEALPLITTDSMEVPVDPSNEQTLTRNFNKADNLSESRENLDQNHISRTDEVCFLVSNQSNQSCDNSSNILKCSDSTETNIITKAQLSAFNDEDASNALLLLGQGTKSLHPDKISSSDIILKAFTEAHAATMYEVSPRGDNAPGDTTQQAAAKCTPSGLKSLVLKVNADSVHATDDAPNSSMMLANAPHGTAAHSCNDGDNGTTNHGHLMSMHTSKSSCVTDKSDILLIQETGMNSDADQCHITKDSDMKGDACRVSEEVSSTTGKTNRKTFSKSVSVNCKKVKNNSISKQGPTTNKNETLKSESNSRTASTMIIPDVKEEVLDILLEKVKKPAPENKDSIFQCHICLRYFKHKGALTQHRRTHRSTENDLIQCNVCQKRFKRKSNLNQHMKIHQGSKEFNCEICGQCFLLRHSLMSHQKVHSSKKPFKCETCDHCFKFQRDLVNHQRIHSGTKPYQCSECGKTFSLNTCLNRHFRTHTGILPYKCDVCGRKFSQNGNMHHHMRNCKQK